MFLTPSTSLLSNYQYHLPRQTLRTQLQLIECSWNRVFSGGHRLHGPLEIIFNSHKYMSCQKQKHHTKHYLMCLFYENTMVSQTIDSSLAKHKHMPAHVWYMQAAIHHSILCPFRKEGTRSGFLNEGKCQLNLFRRGGNNHSNHRAGMFCLGIA